MPEIPSTEVETNETEVKATKVKAKAKPKAEKVKTAAPAKPASELTGTEIKVLTALKKANGPLTRAELKKKTGINAGFSKILGAFTKDDGGVAGDKGLVNRGLVKAVQTEETRGMGYILTANGRKKIEKLA